MDISSIRRDYINSVCSLEYIVEEMKNLNNTNQVLYSQEMANNVINQIDVERDSFSYDNERDPLDFISRNSTCNIGEFIPYLDERNLIHIFGLDMVSNIKYFTNSILSPSISVDLVNEFERQKSILNFEKDIPELPEFESKILTNYYISNWERNMIFIRNFVNSARNKALEGRIYDINNKGNKIWTDVEHDFFKNPICKMKWDQLKKITDEVVLYAEELKPVSFHVEPERDFLGYRHNQSEKNKVVSYQEYLDYKETLSENSQFKM